MESTNHSEGIAAVGFIKFRKKKRDTVKEMKKKPQLRRAF